MAMSGMDMGGMGTSNSSMDASDMTMAFFTSTRTSLWSTSFTPKSAGSYAGMIIFLILFATIYRSLFALKRILEARWMRQAYARRYVVVAGRTPPSEAAQQSDVDSLKQGVLTVNGVDENIRLVQKPEGLGQPQPWRFSVDLPRAVLVTAIAGMTYLLMVAVMTLNVGYFMAILAGTFIGEVAVGRWVNMEDHH